MAAKYPYTQVPGRLRDFLIKLPTMGVPEKASQTWLKSAGWSGGNDVTILTVLRFIGVISQDGTPTESWKALRAGTAAGKATFAKTVRTAYADLFALYPDAHRKDTEALRNFFRQQTTAGEQVQVKTVQTFKVLAEFGDFDSGSPTEKTGAAETPPKEEKAREQEKEVVQKLARTGGGVALNVNIQLQLPATADAEVYEKLFAAMNKHLIGLTD